MTTYAPDTALVVVDVQNDFADPAGSLFVGGGDGLVPELNAEIARALAGGARVVYTQDWHPASTPHFAAQGGLWPVHCVHDTWGAELHPGLDVAGPATRKGTGQTDGYSGFTSRDLVEGGAEQTDLREHLGAGVRRLVVVGLAGDYCVRATALDGRALGHEVEVPLALTRFVDPAAAPRVAAELREQGIAVVGAV